MREGLVDVIAFVSFQPDAAILIVAPLSAAAPGALADEVQPRQLTVPSSERPVTVTLYAASGDAKRPAVIILHGSNGVTSRSMPHFARYATAFSARGIDAYIVSYYSRADIEEMDSPGRRISGPIFQRRLGPWAKLVGDVVSFALTQPNSSQRIGLLGFSRGGFLAVTESALDPRVSALVVLYGGIPPGLGGRITHLPPLLDLHGDADQTVPLDEGKALVAKALELGVPAQQIVYPGEGHAFDFMPDSANSRDATERAVEFLAKTLN